MTQNQRFIQYLSLLLLSELKGNEEFLQSAVWQLYLKVKRICELVCADKISEKQVKELEMEIGAYIDIRIALKNIDKDEGENVDQQNTGTSDELGALETSVVWSELKPKHVFLMSYPMIIRKAGSLAHQSSLRPESKNGDLKK